MTIALARGIAPAICVALLCGTAMAVESPAASPADKTFVAKVSQGGMYEVALGKAAERQGATPDIRDQGNTEAHDHMLVGQALKVAAASAGFSFPTVPNAEFRARLAKISALKGEPFDSAYVADMKEIHAADGAAFLAESKDGNAPALKSFAADTYDIVQRHIGELDAKTTELK